MSSDTRRVASLKSALALAMMLALFSGACATEEPGAPRPLAVIPATGPADQNVAIKIVGEDFWPVVVARYDEPEKSTIDKGFQARLDGAELTAVVFASLGRELQALIPAGLLTPGVHDLEVVDPRGRVGRLTAAYEATGSLPPDLSLDGGMDGRADGSLDTITDSTSDIAPGELSMEGIIVADTTVDAAAPDTTADTLSPDATTDTGPVVASCAPGSNCQIDCTAAGSCAGNINCGSAQSCTITCAEDSCTGDIDCGQADCTISCEERSCLGSITCAPNKRCDISCVGQSCRDPIDCNGACACDISCTASSCWAGAISCPAACQGSVLWPCSGDTVTDPSCDQC